MSTDDARRRLERARAQLLRAESELARREAADQAYDRAALIVRLESTPWEQLVPMERLALTSHRIQLGAAEFLSQVGAAMIAAREGR